MDVNNKVVICGTEKVFSKQQTGKKGKVKNYEHFSQNTSYKRKDFQFSNITFISTWELEVSYSVVWGRGWSSIFEQN